MNGICLIEFLLVVSVLGEPNMYQNLVGFTRIGWVIVEVVFKKLVIAQLVLLKKFGNKVDKIEIFG